MKLNRVLVVLIVVTVGLQIANLWKQYHPKSSQQSERPKPVRDAALTDTFEAYQLPLMGNPSAKVVLVEFSDYECPYCSRHAMTVDKDIVKEFVATGLIRKGFVNLPLPIHANAKDLAGVAICAGKQGSFWEVRELLFNGKPKSITEAVAAVMILPVNTEDFGQCILTKKEWTRVVDRDTEIAKRFNLTGTPSFALGQISTDGVLHIKRFIIGAQPMELFRTEIRNQLRSI